MSETLDAEDVTDIMNALWQRLDQAILNHGGHIDKHIGDAVMALWGVDQAREDDTERAVRAALMMQKELVEFSLDLQRRGGHNLRMRIGIHTGLALLGEVGTTGEFTAIGDTVNTASRLEHAAPVGGILISHDTYRQVRGIFDMQELEPITVKGKVEPIQVYVVERLRPRSFYNTTRGVEGITTRMIGRQEQLQQVQDALRRAIDTSRRQMVTIVGEAGVGKSRLIREFYNWIDGLPERISLFKGRATEEMQNAPYALLRDVLAFRFQIHESDTPDEVRQKVEHGVSAVFENDPAFAAGAQMRAHFIGQLLGFDFSRSPHLQGVFNDARQLRDRALAYLGDFFQAMAARCPTVLFLEDLHWADDSSLDVADSLALSMAEQRLLIVGAARPNLFERHSTWGKAQSEHERIELQPLSRQDSRLLVEEILQKVDDIPDVLREIVIGNAEGNPYYIEELIKMFIDDGVITKGEERWRVEPERLAAARVPPSLTGILQARFDGLPHGERLVLQRASVVGRNFWDDAVAFLGQSENGRLALADALNSLASREMVFFQDPSTFAGIQEYIFKHALLRDATYESVLKRERRIYHARAADWLIQHSGQRAGEAAGMIAEHFERAGQAEQAIPYLKQAGQRATDHYANAEALNYFTRALKLTPESDRQGRYTLLIAREHVYHLLGERSAQQEDLHALAELAEMMGDLQHRAEIALRQATYYDVVSDFPKAMELAQQAAAWAEGIDAPKQQVQGLIAWGRALWRLGEFDEALPKLQKALELAREHKDLPGQATSLHNLGTVYYFLGDHQNARVHLEEAASLRRSFGDRRGEAVSLNNLAGVFHAQGDFVQAKAVSEQVLAVYQQIGDRWNETGSLSNLGTIYHALGELDTAHNLQQRALELYKAVGDRRGESLAAVNLGLVLHDMGNNSQARKYCEYALNLDRENSDREGEGYSLTYLGLALEGLGELESAAGCYQQALHLRREIGQPDRAIEDLAGLARIALKQGQIALATTQAGEIIDWINTQGISELDYPLRIYNTCADILVAVDQKKEAVALLHAAKSLMEDRASKISNENARFTFLEKAPLHHQLQEKLERLQSEVE